MAESKVARVAESRAEGRVVESSVARVAESS